MSDQALSFAHFANLPFIEEMYQKYKVNPSSIEMSWRHFFEGMELGMQRPLDKAGVSPNDLKIYLMIQAYRLQGHRLARFNPIDYERKEEVSFSPHHFGFSSDDMTKTFSTFGVLPQKEASLKDIADALKGIYADKVGVEYPDRMDSDVARYMQKSLEPFSLHKLSHEQQLAIYDDLCRAELFESFIHTRYVGQKRFSLEGAETLIPLLSLLLDEGAKLGACHAVVGMAHRGRLNVLANIFGKSYEEIFHEFEDHYSPELGQGTGDVKYHKGFEGKVKTLSGLDLAMTLCANPSHLEAVDPVVEGRTKGVQEKMEGGMKAALAILIHGDASIAGQGVVYETLQLSRVEGYSTGGTIHIIVNNQIGFTALPKESRSTIYCTDIGKSFSAPIFHINAEDPYSCATIASISIALRHTFGCDVFIDLNGYRKFGHNEGDEPAFTQPLLYEHIRNKKSIRALFLDQLLQEGVLDIDGAKKREDDFKQKLKIAVEKVPPAKETSAPHEEFYTKELQLTDHALNITLPKLIELSKRCCHVPESVKVHPKVQRLFADRLVMIQSEPSKACIDWGAAEMLSIASILAEGKDVRLSGQDCQRGTFSQRHAVWVDQKSGEKYQPLSFLVPNQGRFTVLNSPLSEYAVLGFELGYSLARPSSLTLWEAQYGDFANTAQVIIDQFISSLEQKWGQKSSLVMLLPHGYEGQGPEHSSARLERYLQLCAQGNLILCVCSTPAQYYHMLRRQAHLKELHPLIAFTPKALLRHPLCVSSPGDLAEGSFQEILPDPSVPKARKVIFCSGKIYFDLFAEREKRGLSDVALIRIEQLYPFPEAKVKEQLEKYSATSSIVFAQEEHSNMGPWEYVQPRLISLLAPSQKLCYVGRARSAATAAGSYYLHKKQQMQLMQEAFA